MAPGEYGPVVLVGLSDLLFQMIKNFICLGSSGQKIFDSFQAIVVLDAQPANLSGVKFFKGIDIERGAHDDLVQIAVLKPVFIGVSQLSVRFKSLSEVIHDEATQVSVGVDEKRPTLISSLFDEEIPEGNRQPRLRFCVSFEVRVEKGQFRILPSAVHQDDLGGWIIPEILVHLTQCEIAATEQDSETVVFGPSIDCACPGSDHPLRIRDNDELLALKGAQLLNEPLLNHAFSRL